jgi:WD40 repeat protein
MHAHPQDCPVRQDALERERRGQRLGRWWFRLLNPPPTNPNPELLFTVPAQQGGVNAVALWQGRDGKLYALSGGWDGTLRYWDWTERRCLKVLQGHTGEVTAVALSSDGRHALSGSNDATLRWWDLSAGTSQVLQGHSDNVTAVALSSDSRHALSGSNDATLRWWDLSAGTSQVLQGHADLVRAVALSSDGRHALSGSWDETLRWWDLHTGACLAVFPCGAPVHAVALASRQPHLAAVGLSNGAVHFFRIESR